MDQNAFYYQGMGGLYEGYGPARTTVDPASFPLISYMDTDNNGFFDTIEFDLDGDKKVDYSFTLKDLGISDVSQVYDISKMDYADFNRLEKKVAENTWNNALDFVKLAEKQGINTSWYALLKHPKSIRQQYSQGYWLRFYLFMDCLEKARNDEDVPRKDQVIKNYFK